MFWIKRRTLVALLASAAVGQGSAQITDVDRFKLYDGCRPVVLLIEEVGSVAKQIGLTKDASRLAAESRLRSARLYADSSKLALGYSVLYVNANAINRAFHVSIQYWKAVTDRHGRSNYGTTWNTATTGVHGESSAYIVSALSEQLDMFLADYLRVNAEDCGGPGL